MKVVTWLLLLPGLVWAVLRLVGWDRGVLVQLMSFTTYVAAWSWLPFLVALTRRQWLASSVALVAAAMLTVVIVPRVLPVRGPATGVRLQVMTSNLRLGDADVGTVVGLVRDHDVSVLALQEFTPGAEARLAADGLGALLPYSSLAPELGASGSALYSRFPITDPGARQNAGGFHFRQAYGTIQPPGAAPLVVESAHPTAPSSVALTRGWHTDLIGEPGADPHGTARILLGDFNSTFDHAELRTLLSRGYRDAASAVGRGLVPTWGLYYGPRHLPPITIDHVLVDERIGVRQVRVHQIPESDHRAVLAWLTVPAVAGQPEAK
jgi:endonuclease/exonuclease/phosphatase family metal-dependent hydrolase